MIGGAVDPDTKFGLWTFVWLVCGALYVLFFYSIYHNIPGQSYSTPIGQYYSYIVLFMLNIFFGVFILYLFKGKEFEAFNYALYEQSDNTAGFIGTLQLDSTIILKFAVGLFILGYLTEFITLIIILVVFSYGFQGNYFPNNDHDYEMSQNNVSTLSAYNDVLVSVRVMLFVMVFFFVYHYMNPMTNNSQNMIRNILLITCSLIVLGCGIAQYFLSVKFLQTKLNHDDLFNAVPASMI